MAATDLGLDFSSVPTKVTGGDVIEILDGNEEDDVMNGYKREEELVKIKPDQMVGATAELESDTRRSGRIKIANRQFKDYELYTTMEEEEQLMLAKQWEKIQQMMKRMRKFKPLWRILSWFSTKKKKESSTTAARARARTTGILLTSGVPPPQGQTCHDPKDLC